MTLKEQTEDLLKKVQEAQRRMWELCSESIKSVAGAPMDKKWEASIVATEKVLNSSLQAQNELTALVVERLSRLEHIPESAVDSTRSIQEMVERLTSTQQQIIGTWFETLRKMDPIANKGGNPLAQPVRRLHEQALKALDTQLELLRAWTGQPSKLTTKRASKKATRAKTTTRKKSTAKKSTTKKSGARVAPEE